MKLPLKPCGILRTMYGTRLNRSNLISILPMIGKINNYSPSVRKTLENIRNNRIIVKRGIIIVSNKLTFIFTNPRMMSSYI